MTKEVQKPESDIFIAIKQIIESARAKSYRAVNSFLLESYWQIGRLIIEDEQNGASRAAYGEGILKNLAKALTQEFGKGFDLRNLNNMRAFYLAFPIWNAVRTELSWTHYRLISQLETEEIACTILINQLKTVGTVGSWSAISIPCTLSEVLPRSRPKGR